jgi:hypothetical protein
VSHPFASDGYTWIPTEQKWRWRLRVNPRVHLRFLVLRRALQLAPRPPMGGRAAVERLLSRAVPAHRVDLGDVARRSTTDGEEDGAAAGPLTDACAHRWVAASLSSGISAGPYPRHHGGSRACSYERRLGIYPHGEWIHPHPVVAATGS